MALDGKTLLLKKALVLVTAHREIKLERGWRLSQRASLHRLELQCKAVGGNRTLTISPSYGPCMLTYDQSVKQDVPTGAVMVSLVRGNQPLSD